MRDILGNYRLLPNAKAYEFGANPLIVFTSYITCWSLEIYKADYISPTN